MVIIPEMFIIHLKKCFSYLVQNPDTMICGCLLPHTLTHKSLLSCVPYEQERSRAPALLYLFHQGPDALPISSLFLR